MHYYKFNIADYRKDTGHLSTIEHGIYRQLIDWYYLDEQPIPEETQVVIDGLPDESQNNLNQEPITNNHKPIKENKRGSRLAQDWFLTKAMGDWATQERPDLDVRQVAHQFKDYWVAQAGQKGVKLDWDATWRNWVRNTKAVKPNPYDVGRLTVARSNEPDPALLKIEEDAKKAAPIPLEVLARMAQIRQKA